MKYGIAALVCALVALPAMAKVLALTIDGKDVPPMKDGNRVWLPLPGGGGVRRIHRQGGTAPRNAQTDEARVLQMFETEVMIDDPDQVLRPGMSADVAIPKG